MLARGSSKREGDQGVVLSPAYLKSLTNKFDLEVIFHLNLSGCKLKDLKPLEECKGLLLLDISNNSINDLRPLSRLNKMVFLQADINMISDLAPLKGASSLARLSLVGNQVKAPKDTVLLNGLKELRTLSFMSLMGENPNPCCTDKTYRATVLKTLPALERLDGAPRKSNLPEAIEKGVQGEGKAGNSELERLLKEGGPTEWFKGGLGKEADEWLQKNKKSGESKEEKAIAEKVDECKKEQRELEQKLKKLQEVLA
jgi:hypothetical protein